MAAVACCTCASVLIGRGPGGEAHLETKNEKQLSTPNDRKLECCGRVICGQCIYTNPRFAAYCPYCQIASSPTNPLPQGLREPPSYDFATSKSAPAPAPAPTASKDEQLPPYTPPTQPAATAISEKTPPDTLHFLHPTHDTIASLSLRYNIPAAVLRAHNNLPADHLLAARRTLLIPGRYNPSGISLSPRPVEGEAEEARKNKIRRWMVSCKCAEYDVAVLYLEACGYDLGVAVARFLEDEEWERRNPLAKGKGKGKVGGGGVWASQAAFLRRGGRSS